MRIIVYGVGAIGGVVAGALAESGQEVVGIARGGMLEALRAGPLTLRGVERRFTVTVPVVAEPAEIAFRPDDAILLTMKTQDTLPALLALRAAGVTDQAIFCAQNGIANEPMALRLFPNVHGVTVMMPAGYLTPGEVVSYVFPRFGMFELGRFPSGLDDADTALAAALDRANIAAFPDADVMAGKRGKLLMNVGNILEAALGPGNVPDDLRARVVAESEAALRAAGLAWRDVGHGDPRRAELMRPGSVDGEPRAGSSTTQSLKRATGALETDWLNGEIALIGRLHGVPVPLNAGLTALAARFARERVPPGTMSVEALEAALAG